MSKYLIIATHFQSGSYQLVKILNSHPKFAGEETRICYKDALCLQNLKDFIKHDKQFPILFDIVKENVGIQTTGLYSSCKFIYLIKQPKHVLGNLSSIFSMNRALKYYCFRLRRICEMAHKTPGAVFLTWDDVGSGKGLPLIEDYFSLTNPLEILKFSEVSSQTKVPKDIRDKAEECYDRHLRFLYSLDLRCC